MSQRSAVCVGSCTKPHAMFRDGVTNATKRSTLGAAVEAFGFGETLVTACLVFPQPTSKNAIATRTTMVALGEPAILRRTAGICVAAG